MPEPRTKYGPFCARAGIVSVAAKRKRMRGRLEGIFFFLGGGGFLSFRYQIRTLSLYNNKHGDVEVKKRTLLEKNVQKKRSEMFFYFFILS